MNRLPTPSARISACPDSRPRGHPLLRVDASGNAVPSRPVLYGGESFTVGVVLAHSRDLDGPTGVGEESVEAAVSLAPTPPP